MIINIKIMNIENFNLFKLYNHLLITHSCINGIKLGSAVKSCLANIFYSHICLQIKKNKRNDNSIIFLRGSIKRHDIDKMIENVQLTVKDGKYDELIINQKKIIDLFRFEKLLFKSIKWFIVIRHNGYSLEETFLCIAETCKMYDIYNYFKKNNSFSQYKLCVLFYDALPIENFISQYAQMNGCKTATLQHGVMLARRPMEPLNIDFAGVEFESFVSDYFLAWNDFTKQEAIKAGVCGEKVFVLGVAKCIGAQAIKVQNNNVIGILLDGKFEEENNEPMIKLAVEFCRKHKMTCILRYHPNFKGDEYQHLMESEITNVCDKKLSLTEFLSNIEFCILSNTTVLFEIEDYSVPYIRYSSRTLKDKFKDCSIRSYNNIKEMEACYMEMKTYRCNVSSSKLEHNVLSNHSSFDRYADFFNEFI